MDLLAKNIRPRDICTMEAFENAARVVAATGGSTNGALHLPAMAHEAGIEFDLFDVAEIFRRTPYVADLKPGGKYVAKDMFEAGGIPMLIIGGQGPRSLQDMGSLQDMNHVDLMRPITKWSHSVPEARRLAEYVSMAFRIATTGVPGPVFLEMPLDLLMNVGDDADLPATRPLEEPPRPAGDAACSSDSRLGWLMPTAAPKIRPSVISIGATAAHGSAMNTHTMTASDTRRICHSLARCESQGMAARAAKVPTANSENTVPMTDAE